MKLFVLIKEDMPLAYQGVQGGHAVAQWLLDNTQNPIWQNETLVFLKCKDLDLWMMKLNDLGIKYSTFREPDMNNIVTAIATVVEDEKIFKKLNLIGT